jgi:hypothetical protein
MGWRAFGRKAGFLGGYQLTATCASCETLPFVATR